jgi:hypothetical protein
MGGIATLVWQAEQACCSAVAGFSDLDGWWQVSHLMLRAWE